VLKSFREVVEGVRQMLEPARLAEFQKNVATLDNRAIFEIPEMLARLLDQPADAAERSAAPAIGMPTSA
jgi:hypothetical protein